MEKTFIKDRVIDLRINRTQEGFVVSEEFLTAIFNQPSSFPEIKANLIEKINEVQNMDALANTMGNQMAILSTGAGYSAYVNVKPVRV